MNHDTAITLLDDHVDGLLGAEQTAALEAHLAACPTCRAELAQLRALLEQAAALPAELLPERDLWGGIAAQIEHRTNASSPSPSPRRDEERRGGVVSPPWHTRPRVLLLAAALLVGTTAVATRLISPPVEPLAPLAQAPVEPLPLRAWEQEMTTASVALDHTLEARKADLQPATIAIIEDNLRIIDSAIEDCRAALEQDPANTRMEGALLEAWQQRVDLLERAAGLPTNA